MELIAITTTGSIPVTSVATLQAKSFFVKNVARTRGNVDFLGKFQTTPILLPYGAGKGNRRHFVTLGRSSASSDLPSPTVAQYDKEVSLPIHVIRSTHADRFRERVKGIEPSSTPWEGVVLPVNYTRKSTSFVKARPLLYYLIFLSLSFASLAVSKLST